MRRYFLGVLLLLSALLSRAPIVMADTDPREDSRPYGVLAFVAWDHDWNSYYEGGENLETDAALAQAAGITWMRMDFLWSDIEPEKDHFDFVKYDRILTVLNEHGIHVLGILEYNPSWREGEWNAAPDPAAYQRFARETITHFKDRVKYWEVWNEPDQDTYWMPQDDLTAYSALLKSVYPVIKEADPTAQVVMGGLAKDYPFHLRSIYKKAGAQSFDIVNIHPFVSPLRMNAMNEVHGIYVAVKNVMAEFGDEQKPIWFTEIGCPGVQSPNRSNAWWEGESPTENQQAEWVTLLYKTAPKWPGVDKIFWAFLRETPGHFGNGVDHFGLLRSDFAKKPAYEAYRAIANPPEPPAEPDAKPPTD